MVKHTKLIISILIIGVVVFATIAYLKVIRPSNEYQRAEQLLEEGNYEDAKEIFSSLGMYRDSMSKVEEIEILQSKKKEEEKKEADYQQALSLYDKGEYREALKRLASMKYKDSEAYVERCKDNIYQAAETLLENKNWDEAIEFFQCISDYKDSTERIEYANEQKAYDTVIENYQAGYIQKTLDAINQVSEKNEEIKAIEKEIEEFRKKYGEWLGIWDTENTDEKIIVKAYNDNGLKLCVVARDGVTYKDVEEKPLSIIAFGHKGEGELYKDQYMEIAFQSWGHNYYKEKSVFFDGKEKEEFGDWIKLVEPT